MRFSARLLYRDTGVSAIGPQMVKEPSSQAGLRSAQNASQLSRLLQLAIRTPRSGCVSVNGRSMGSHSEGRKLSRNGFARPSKHGRDLARDWSEN